MALALLATVAISHHWGCEVQHHRVPEDVADTVVNIAFDTLPTLISDTTTSRRLCQELTVLSLPHRSRTVSSTGVVFAVNNIVLPPRCMIHARYRSIVHALEEALKSVHAMTAATPSPFPVSKYCAG